MKEGGHHIVVVSGEGRDALARLPVPDADDLVVGGAEDPGELVVELDGADVIEMAEKGEKTTTQLVVPHLDLVIVTSRNEERLRLMETHSSHGACSVTASQRRQSPLPFPLFFFFSHRRARRTFR